MSDERIPVKLPRLLGDVPYRSKTGQDGYFHIDYDTAVRLMQHPALHAADRVYTAVMLAAVQDHRCLGGPFEFSVEKFAEATKLSQTNVKRQLARLDKAGFITWKRGAALRPGVFSIPALIDTPGVSFQRTQVVCASKDTLSSSAGGDIEELKELREEEETHVVAPDGPTPRVKGLGAAAQTQPEKSSLGVKTELGVNDQRMRKAGASVEGAGATHRNSAGRHEPEPWCSNPSCAGHGSAVPTLAVNGRCAACGGKITWRPRRVSGGGDEFENSRDVSGRFHLVR